MDMAQAQFKGGSLKPPPRFQRAKGGLAFSVAVKSGAPKLSALRQDAPCRVFFPTRADATMMEAILVNTGGGLVEGDHISVAIRVGVGARLTVGSQGAEKIYRSLTDATLVETNLTVAADGVLIWSPQETIIFDGAKVTREQRVAVEKTSRFLAVEVLVFGRIACGEQFTYGQLRDSWSIRCGGELLWVDRLRLEGDVKAKRTRRFAFGDSAGLGTIIYFGCDSSSLLPLARSCAERLGGGASLVNGVLVARFLNSDEAGLRASSSAFAESLRATIAASARLEAA